MEYAFDDSRKWRFDYAWPKHKLAVEIDGFGFGHQSIPGIMEDHRKRNTATLRHWRILVFDSGMLGTIGGVEEAVDDTARLIEEAIYVRK